MGQTLTTGVYLPDEGERNCYTGLAGNWQALDNHLGNANIHVTYEDKQAWNGKADASALTAHTGDTTIHVTAEDKAKWDAVTGKANDADVVHKSGNETINGNKTFSSINGVEPSSLSLPDLANKIDISSYITHLDKVVNSYTPSVNGYIYIRVRKTSLPIVSIRIQQNFGLMTSCETSDYSTWGTYLPVVAGKVVEFYISADSLSSAIFFPCQGNV